MYLILLGLISVFRSNILDFLSFIVYYLALWNSHRKPKPWISTSVIGSSNFQLHCWWTHCFTVYYLSSIRLTETWEKVNFTAHSSANIKEAQYISSESQMRTGPHMCLLNSTGPPYTAHFGWLFIAIVIHIISNLSTMTVGGKRPLKCLLSLFMCVWER